MSVSKPKHPLLENVDYAVKMALIIRTKRNGRRQELRFTELKMAIRDELGYPVSDAPLSRALKRLKMCGEIIHENERYSLARETSRDDRLKAAELVDLTRIHNAGDIGAITEIEEAYNFYGVPPSLQTNLNQRLQDEVVRFQTRVLKILDRENRTFARSLERKARGHVSEEVVARSLLALEDLTRFARQGGEEAGYALWLAEVENLPSEHDPAIYINRTMALKLPTKGKAAISSMAGLFGVSEEEFEEMGDRQKALRELMSALGPEEEANAKAQLKDLGALNMALCAVVRFPIRSPGP
jgi:hypothetical protein